MQINGMGRKMATVLIGLVMGSTAARAASSQDSWIQTAEGVVEQEVPAVTQDFASPDSSDGSKGTAKSVKLSTGAGKKSKTSKKKKTSKSKGAKKSKKKSKKSKKNSQTQSKSEAQ